MRWIDGCVMPDEEVDDDECGDDDHPPRRRRQQPDAGGGVGGDLAGPHEGGDGEQHTTEVRQLARRSRLSTGLRARRHTTPRAPNSAARPVDAARKLWSPRRTQLPTNAIAHGNTTVSSPTAAPIAASHDGRPPHPRRLPGRQRRHEQRRSPASTSSDDGREPQLRAAGRGCGGRRAEHVELRLDRRRLPISRPIGQATAATSAPSTARLNGDVEQGGDHRAAEPTRPVAQEPVPRRLRVRGSASLSQSMTSAAAVAAGRRRRGRASTTSPRSCRPTRRPASAPLPSRRHVRVGRGHRGRTPRRGCRRRSSTPRGPPAARSSRIAIGRSGRGDRPVRLVATGDGEQARPPRRRAGRDA